MMKDTLDAAKYIIDGEEGYEQYASRRYPAPPRCDISRALGQGKEARE